MRLTFSIVVLLALSACAAAPSDPCATSCSHVYDSCMEGGQAGLSGDYALARLSEQCDIGQQVCIAACRQQVPHSP